MINFLPPKFLWHGIFGTKVNPFAYKILNTFHFLFVLLNFIGEYLSNKNYITGKACPFMEKGKRVSTSCVVLVIIVVAVVVVTVEHGNIYAFSFIENLIIPKTRNHPEDHHIICPNSGRKSLRLRVSIWPGRLEM